jgi:lipoprotein-releasing system ATP-binding protein
MNKTEPAIHLDGIARHYTQGDAVLDILQGAELTVYAGQSVALMAPSGTGKSTLLHIAGLLEHPDAGEVYVKGVATSGLGDAARTAIRRTQIGFVYQFHHLLPEFSALENVTMPLAIRRMPEKQMRERGAAMLEEVGLAHRLQHRPGELSGGERQRVAVARALVTNPACVLADEPTGNLDRENAYRIFDLILELNRRHGAAFVMVTHDRDLAGRMQRTLRIDDGRIT